MVVLVRCISEDCRGFEDPGTDIFGEGYCEGGWLIDGAL